MTKWNEVILVQSCLLKKKITSISEVLRKITEHMMNERDSLHINHSSVLLKSQFINTVILEHTGRREPLITHKDIETEKTRKIIQKYMDTK